MKRREYLKAAGVGGVTVLAGCSGGGTSDGDGDAPTESPMGTTVGGGESGPITIGALEPQSGPFSPWATVHLEGLRIALSEINESGNLDGELLLEVTDTGADPAEADSAFRRHVEQDDAVAVTGPVSSDVGIRTAQTAAELQVPNFLHMAGSMDILSSDTRYTFRTGWLPSESHARADAQFFEANDVSSVGVIIADYAWGRSFEAALEEFTPSGIDLQIEAAPVGESDFTSFLRQFSDDVELMDFAGHPPGSVTAASQMFELDMDQTILGVDPPQLLMIQVLGENVTNDVITRHLTLPGTGEFNSLGEKVTSQFEKPMYAYQGIAYMTGHMIGEAIAEVGRDPTGIADYVRNGSFDMLYARPLEYTEWGEFKEPSLIYSRLVEGAPSYYPDASHTLQVDTQTDPLPAPEPPE